LVAVDCKINCRIADITAGLNRRSELDIKGYEIAIFITIAINGDPVDSIRINFEIDVIEILMVFIFVRYVDIY
jgi:hypothetical protein